MTNEEIIEEILFEAEQYRLREYVLELTKTLMEKNPRMDRADAIRMSYDHAKLHSGVIPTK